MDNLVVATNTVSTAVEEDFTDEILANNGLSHIPNTATVVQTEDNNLLVKHETEDTLTPPPIDVDSPVISPIEDTPIDWDVEEFANSLLNQDSTDDEDNEDPEGYAIIDTDNNTVTVVDEEGSHTQELQNTDALSELRRQIDEDIANSSVGVSVASTDIPGSSVDEIVSEVANTSVEDLAIAEALENAEDADSSNSSLELSNEEIIDSLPENKPLFEIAESRLRFSGASWFKLIQNQTVIIAGQGGIGRF